MAEAQTVETPDVKSLDFMQQRNEREAALKAGTPAPEKPAPIEVKPVDTKADSEPPRPSRSERRAQNRLREEIGELRGKLAAYEELGVKPAQAAPGAEDPEPKRDQFKTDAEHQRALGRWDARQEAKKLVGNVQEEASAAQQRQEWEDHVRAMAAKMTEDIKTLPDWDEVAKDAEELEYVPSEHPTLMGFIHSSDLKAFILYHFAKHPDEFQKMLDMSKTPAAQIRAMGRLEGRIEKLYSTEKAAQAPEKAPKDREDPADPSKDGGRNSAVRETGKPRPSTEVAARGGSAAPEKPALGSPQWMAERNRQQYGR